MRPLESPKHSVVPLFQVTQCLLPALLCLAVACGEENPVPFGQGSAETPAETVEGEFEARVSQPANGPDHATVEGAEFRFEGAAIYALFTEDVDRDGDRDVLALALRATGDGAEALLVFGRREGDRIVAQVLGSQRMDDCASPSAEAEIRADAPGRRVGTITVRCEESTTHITFVAAAGATPRLRERVAGRGFVPRVEFPDIDNDGHEDLRAVLSVHETEIVLDWLDRPGGLARDRAEPAATLRAAGPHAAALAATLCGDTAEVAIGGHWGLECPPELLRQIRLSAALALARTDLPGALLVLSSLGNEEAEAFFAEFNVPTVRATSLAHVLPESPTTRHAALSFQDETTLIDHATGVTVSPSGLTTPYLGGPPIPSADGTQGVRALTVGRDGRARVDLGDATEGSVFHSPTAASVPIPGDANGGWLVLGWAPQGMLLFDGSKRLLMTLGGSGEASLQEVGADALPAPLQGARTNRDGSRWAAETPFGVLVGTPDGVELWRPREWDRERPAIACALSPSGQRVAIARADGIWLLSKAQPSTPAGTPPSTPLESGAERLP